MVVGVFRWSTFFVTAFKEPIFRGFTPTSNEWSSCWILSTNNSFYFLVNVLSQAKTEMVCLENFSSTFLIIECDAHCASECSIRGGGKCDGNCTNGYGPITNGTDAFTCMGKLIENMLSTFNRNELPFRLRLQMWRLFLRHFDAQSLVFCSKFYYWVRSATVESLTHKNIIFLVETDIELPL